MVELLLDKGADIDARNKRKDTALILAVYYQKLTIARILVYRSADLTAKQIDNQDAWYFANYNKNKALLNILENPGKAITAVKNNNLPELKRLIDEEGVNIETIDRNDSRKTLLILAAIHNNTTDIIKFLLSRGADINSKDLFSNNALFNLALISNKKDIILELLNSGISYGSTLAWVTTKQEVKAIVQNFDTTIQTFISNLRNFTADFISIVSQFPLNGVNINAKIERKLVVTGSPISLITLLMAASYKQNVNAVNALLNNVDIDIDAQSTNLKDTAIAMIASGSMTTLISPILYPTQNANTANIIETLINKEANLGLKNRDNLTIINYIRKIAQFSQENRIIPMIATESAIINAVKNNHVESVKMLINEGISVNIVDDNKSNLLFINYNSINPSLNMTKVLINRGININQQNIYNNTALTAIVGLNDVKYKDIIIELLNKGANKNIRNNVGTPLEIATQNNNREIIEILQSDLYGPKIYTCKELKISVDDLAKTNEDKERKYVSYISKAEQIYIGDYFFKRLTSSTYSIVGENKLNILKFNGKAIADYKTQQLSLNKGTIDAEISSASLFGSTISVENAKIKFNGIVNALSPDGSASVNLSSKDENHFFVHEPYISFEAIDKTKDAIIKIGADKIIINEATDINLGVVRYRKSFDESNELIDIDCDENNVLRNISLRMPKSMAFLIQVCSFRVFVEKSGYCTYQYCSVVNENCSGTNILNGTINNTQKAKQLKIKIYIDKEEKLNYLTLIFHSRDQTNGIAIQDWFRSIENAIFGGQNQGQQKSIVYISKVEYKDVESDYFSFSVDCGPDTLSLYDKRTNFFYMTNVLRYKTNQVFQPSNTMIIYPNYEFIQNEEIQDLLLSNVNYKLQNDLYTPYGKIFVGMNGVKNIVIDKKDHVINLITNSDNAFRCYYTYDSESKDLDENLRHNFDEITKIDLIQNGRQSPIEMKGMTCKLNIAFSEMKTKEDFVEKIPSSILWDTNASHRCPNTTSSGWYEDKFIEIKVYPNDTARKLSAINNIRNPYKTELISEYTRQTIYYTCDEWKIHNKDDLKLYAFKFFNTTNVGKYLSEIILIEGKNSASYDIADAMFEFSPIDITSTEEKVVILPGYYADTSTNVNKETEYTLRLNEGNASGFASANIDGMNSRVYFTNNFQSDELNSGLKESRAIMTIIFIISTLISIASFVLSLIKKSIEVKRTLTEEEKKIFKWIQFGLDVTQIVIGLTGGDVGTFMKIDKEKRTLESTAKFLKFIASNIKSISGAVILAIPNYTPPKVEKIIKKIVAIKQNVTFEDLAKRYEMKEYVENIMNNWSEGLQKYLVDIIKIKDPQEDMTTDERKEFIQSVSDTIIARVFDLDTHADILSYRLSLPKDDTEFIILKYLQNIRQFGAEYIYSTTSERLSIEDCLLINYLLINNCIASYLLPFRNLWSNKGSNNNLKSINAMEYSEYKCPYSDTRVSTNNDTEESTEENNAEGEEIHDVDEIPTN